MGLAALIGSGSFSRIDDATEIWLLPSNARFPVAISYSTAPSAKMSLRASASFPSICSGDMYWIVPTMLPAVVNGLAGLSPVRVAAAVNEGAAPEAGAAMPKGLAKPKSISFAPDLVSMMFAGFKSRCTMPARCANSKASATSAPIFSTSFRGSELLAEPLRDRLSFEQLHDQVVGSVLRTNVIELANVGMVQGRDRTRLPLQPLLQFRRRRKMGSQNLDGDLPVEASVPRPIDFAHAARAQCRLDFVGSEFGARGEGHPLAIIFLSVRRHRMAD